MLRHQVEIFFSFGPDLASFVFGKLQGFAAGGSNKLIGSKFDVSLSGLDSKSLSQWSSLYPWNSCKMAATLVLLFAAPRDSESLFFAVKTQSRSLGGLPTLEHIRETPSASLDTAYRRAKQDAFGDGKRTTVMAVNLTDVHIFELVEQGKAQLHFSFAHVFVIAVGPEGAVIWQSWGKFGYRLDEYLNRGGGQLRDWQEADQFVNDFTKLVSGKGTWTAKRNKLYERLFHIDLNHICGPKGLEKPLTSKFKPWVRISTLEDVRYEHVTKFRWSAPSVG
ncbi:uncharacterized protein SETTUDRAFT_111360 [Exserohilum turcica Et28A]|uniref:Uncharacterized protein n=1 Tax=Exserohilum turcicum (strain 28A) TaxID=671987 RepID=R0KBV4_EXST2|nr:uncharacterized protein SETTUDRAFT_111360 [Exserohilum turcica Et28A]EOA85692.1 hypothetical protein SETTUDRAFT_111360 [Exserohilum turcica Et28A]